MGAAIGFIGITVAGMMVTRNLALDGTYTYLRLFNEVVDLIRRSYVDEVETASLMDGAYDGLLSELDPFSEYLTPQEYAEYVAARETGKAPRADAGIRTARKEGVVLVVSVKPGSDAESKGITPGDRIRRIGELSTREMTLQQVESALSGQAGKIVSISVLRREEPRKIDADLELRETAMPPASLVIADAKEGVAVLRITHLGPGASAEVSAALEKAVRQKVKRLVIDLRGNAWGDPAEAARTAGLFVGSEVVARLSARDGAIREEVRSTLAKAAYAGSVGLLIDGATADAAELFAAALHDLRHAELMGETSFGIGAQQEFIPLKNGSYLRLSTRKYLSPSGTAWHVSGLPPSTPITVSQENLSRNDRLQQQLNKALLLDGQRL